MAVRNFLVFLVGQHNINTLGQYRSGALFLLLGKGEFPGYLLGRAVIDCGRFSFEEETSIGLAYTAAFFYNRSGSVISRT